MTRARRIVLAAVAAALLAGALPATAYTPPKPPTGTWKIQALSGTTAAGTFSLARGTGKYKRFLYVTALKVTTAPNSGGCPPAGAVVKLARKVKLRTFTSGGYTSWGYGKQSAAASNQIDPGPARLTIDGTAINGGLQLVWDYANPKLVIRVGVVAGSCSAYFAGASHR